MERLSWIPGEDPFESQGSLCEGGRTFRNHRKLSDIETGGHGMMEVVTESNVMAEAEVRERKKEI